MARKKTYRMYLLNSLIVPFTGSRAVFRISRITESEARLFVEIARDDGDEVISALGHEGAVQAFRALGIMDAVYNRVQVQFEGGDKAIALVLRGRLLEGKVLTLQEMQEIGYDLYLIERIEK